MFISGLNIDISPEPGQIFPLTKFVPWAAYIQSKEGQSDILEQEKLITQINKQSTENPQKIDLEQVIQEMMNLQ